MLNREPMGMKQRMRHPETKAANPVSVLNREPMGMKHMTTDEDIQLFESFSAQPRADGDEARSCIVPSTNNPTVSVLNREPMGMKQVSVGVSVEVSVVSVLNREPMGMKPIIMMSHAIGENVSVLNREPMGMKRSSNSRYDGWYHLFQCSTASRWG